jgi:hypothetical protein
MRCAKYRRATSICAWSSRRSPRIAVRFVSGSKRGRMPADDARVRCERSGKIFRERYRTTSVRVSPLHASDGGWCGESRVDPARTVEGLEFLKERYQTMATDERPKCPKCDRPMEEVKDAPDEIDASVASIIAPLESHIHRCHEHGLWRIFVSGAVVPYRNPPDAKE